MVTNIILCKKEKSLIEGSLFFSGKFPMVSSESLESDNKSIALILSENKTKWSIGWAVSKIKTH